ncbi:beta-alanine transporter [Wyeomyia smithii]|uniref:beta-alanine transporter n=1 Tax=Wyeomyia smithii TaxID=174621 RepID=UPI002467D26C|nr:beta-alanine transporter [Wyeomyia smithii]
MSKPAHWCRIPEFDKMQSWSSSLMKNLSIPSYMKDGISQYSQCSMYVRNYTYIAEVIDKMRNGTIPLEIISVSLNTTACQHGWVYDKSLFESTVVTQWDLVCEKDFYTTAALSVFGVAGLIGNFAFGYMQDYWGRKTSFYIYLLIELTACALGVVTQSFGQWLLSRFIVGLTVPAILSSPYVLAIELVEPTKRDFCTIVSNIAYSIGLIMLAGVVHLYRGWKALSLAVSLPFVSLFIFYYFIPESPRWLLTRNRFREAAKIMKHMARINRKPIPANYEIVLKNKLCSSPEIASVTVCNYGIKDLFVGKQLARKTIIITYIWFTNTSVYVGLSYYAPALGGDEIMNFFLAGVVELPTYIVLWPSLYYCGRRWILCVSMMLGGFACLFTFITQAGT